ncbi:MAG: tRNA pseudouridine(38-40) synthase TruA [Bacteroidales bacterium]|nr:tRNA pseudouridine(38-40) synthase TruA [Bacteroidales bacterium]
MQRQHYFISLSYNGTTYHGWQIQKNAVTVQQVLNEKLSLKFQEPIEVTGAGRTDTGVHAHFFVAYFDANNFNLDNPVLIEPLNRFLPADIVVHQIIKTKPEANARFDARSRTYRYYLSSTKTPFFADLRFVVPQLPDMVKMNVAAEKLLTVSDFTAFAKLHSDNKTNICKLTEAKWVLMPDGMYFTVIADRFLRNMVRAIVGSLMEVGYGKLIVDDFLERVLKKDRYFASLTAPAHGLFLYDIGYPDEIFVNEKNPLIKLKDLFV